MAYGMLYERLMRHRDDLEQARVDAILGMPGAAARHVEALAEVLMDAGMEVK